VTWEEVSQQHVLRDQAGVTAIGRWWGQVPVGSGPRTEEREIDVVGLDGTRTPIAIGMCKWTNNRIDFDELNLLDRLAPHIEGFKGTAHRYLFSRSGFTDRLSALAHADPSLHLVTPANIYSTPG
jgi:hypothetical protein